MRKIKYNSSELSDLYNKGLSTSVIAKKIGGTQAGVWYTLNKNNIKMRDLSDSHRIYHCKKNIFDTINTQEKAYWLGFIYADGCVKNNSLIIKLHNKDKDHLEKFLTFMVANNPIKQDLKNCSGIQITDKELIKGLKKWGVVERKSFIIIKPKIRKKLIPHFYRGYFDGDGWITSQFQKNKDHSISSTRRKILNIGFSCGSKHFLESIRQEFSVVCNKSVGSLHKIKNKRHYQLSFGGNVSTGKILKYLYKDATIFLSRKMEIVLNLVPYFLKGKKEKFMGLIKDYLVHIDFKKDKGLPEKLGE